MAYYGGLKGILTELGVPLLDPPRPPGLAQTDAGRPHRVPGVGVILVFAFGLAERYL